MTSAFTQPADVQPLLVTAPQAARMLGISERTLWSLTAPRGPIPVVRIGRSVRYSLDDLRVWIDEAKTTNGNGRPSR